VKLTQKTVDAIKPGERRIFWDDALPGFGVRVTEGSVSYIVDFRIGSRRRRVTLDPVRQVPIATARERAREVLVGVAKT
jgi:Arm DNA-binding domain